jgi:hypothetical protein
MLHTRHPLAAASVAAVLALLGCTRESDPRPGPGAPEEGPVGEAQQASCTVPYEEFISYAGSWPSWTQLPAGLSGTDITAQLTALVNSLPSTAQTGGASTLYLPAGNYYLHSTLQLVDGFGITIVGEDPATTTITWTGPAGADMLQVVDTGYAKLSRITLDGNNTAGALVHIMQSPCYPNPAVNAACNLPVPAPGVSSAGGIYFLEFNDDVFRNAQYGIVGDYSMLPNTTPAACYPQAVTGCDPNNPGAVQYHCGTHCADPMWTQPPAGVIPTVNSNLGNNVIRRSTFSNLSSFGIITANQNALDWLVADSRFSNSGFGTTGAAVARVYNGSYVLTNNSFTSNNRDILLQGPAADVVRGNTSIGSNEFLWAGGGTWTYQLDVSGNYISASGAIPQHVGVNECVNVNNPTPPGFAMCLSISNVTLLDNYVNVPNGVSVYYTGTPEIVEGGNAFPAGTADLTSFWSGYSATRLTVAPDDTSVNAPAPAAAAFAWSMQYNAGANYWGSTPTKASRNVTNVATAFPQCLTTPTTCGNDITQWLATKPLNAALYFPSVNNSGQAISYHLESPIDVPGGLDVTLFGDGAGSKILWNGAPGALSDPYMVHFKAAAIPGGSPQGSIRDLELLAVAGGTSRPGGILVDVFDNTGDMVFVDTVNASFTKSLIDVAGVDKVLVRADQSGGGNERALGVTGGGAGANGSANTQGVVMFAGGAGVSGTMVDLRNWGKAVLIGTDNEGLTQGYTLAQSGYLTMDGGRLAVGHKTVCGAAGQPPDPNYGCCTGTFPKNGVCTNAFAVQPDVLVQSTFRGKATFMNLDDGAQFFSTSNPAAQVLSLSNGFGIGYNGNSCSLDACTFTQQNPIAYGANNQLAVFDYDICGPVTIYGCISQPSSGSSAPLMPPAAAIPKIADMLADVRATYEAPGFRPCGAANVRIHRIFVEGITTSDPADFMRAAIRVQHY